jgi:hypothetical protein
VASLLGPSVDHLRAQNRRRWTLGHSPTRGSKAGTGFGAPETAGFVFHCSRVMADASDFRSAWNHEWMAITPARSPTQQPSSTSDRTSALTRSLARRLQASADLRRLLLGELESEPRRARTRVGAIAMSPLESSIGERPDRESSRPRDARVPRKWRNQPAFVALVLFPGVLRRRRSAGCPRRCCRSAFFRVLENVHAFGTQAAALRPSVKGAAARLAALGPDGPPLTAGLHPAGCQ